MPEQRLDAVGPGIRPPLFFSAMVGALVLYKAFSLPAPLPKAARAAGIPLIVSGLIISGSGFRAQRMAGTSPNPNEPVSSLVESGPYRFTRNPMYLGMGLILAGLAILMNAIWGLLLVPLFVLGIDRRMIQPEEAYLDQKFGEAYHRYKDRVPRWL